MRTIDSPAWVTTYAFLLAVMVPMDWFAPTAELFREFGAKPATLLLTLGGMYGILLALASRATINRTEFMALLTFLAWLALGFLAAFVNFVFGWSDWSYSRSPFTQLLAQSLIIAACTVAVVGNARLMRAYPIAELVAQFLPAAVIIHLSFFILEALGVVQDSSGALLLFRADKGAIERPTGLYSEPSYFGTFAALYGTALLFIPGRVGGRLIRIILAIALYACAIAIGAKTLVVVAAAQVALLLLRSKKSASNLALGAVMFAAVAGCALYFVQNLAMLDVEENLSSAMRLGSTLLATNAITDGYGLPGIGTGQFHFLYRNEFAPDFLLLSTEASEQLGPEAVQRASTFNFFLRVFLETGAAGFALLVFCLWKLWRAVLPASITFVSLIFAGALGFLMTQDTWFYPPLVFSAAAILAHLDGSPAVAPGARQTRTDEGVANGQRAAGMADR